jgi:Trypsin-like peptidase domain
MGPLTGMIPLLALFAAGPEGGAREAVFERFRPSILTIEVHPLQGQARSVLGSGYVVAPGARIVTNYHVVASYIQHPGRYRLQVKSGSVATPATLLAFDLINDLALLQADVKAPPLRLAAGSGSPGAPVIAFGNPEGLGLSLIEGVFNGFAEKGFVDRMLLSMPLNSGMSGGPILNARHEVVGTNVSVFWRSNSLSFGVPVAAVHTLLQAPPVATSEEALRVEGGRQLQALEQRAVQKAIKPFLEARDRVHVGAAEMPRPPEAFECWNYTHEEELEGISKTSYQCNLQFTPSLEDLGEVASIEVLVEHFISRRSRYGFYGGLGSHAAQHHGVESRAPGNGMMSPPRCASDRVRSDHLVWKTTTCSYAYVRHPELGYFALAATSVSRPGEAVYLAVHGRGIGIDSFLALGRALLREVRLGDAP